MGIVRTSPQYSGKYVQCFYSVLGKEEGEVVHRRLPDGTLDLVFNLGAVVSLSRDDVQFTDMPAVSLTGLYPDRSFLRYQAAVHLVGVVFQPGTAHLFINDSLAYIKASTLDAADVFGHDVYSLLEQLRELPDEVSRHQYLERFLHGIVLRKQAYHQENILQAVQQIQQSYGNLDIATLHKDNLMSERNFRRKFTDCVGMNPKQYANIIRIKAFSKQYESTRAGYKQVLYQLGYTDPSHFNKDFQKIVGTTPGCYFGQLPTIAGDFIHLI